MRRKRKQLWALCDWHLHHDNTLADLFVLGTRFLGRISHRTSCLATYSPDLALYNFWLYPKLKLVLKEKRFQTVDNVQIEENETILVILKEDCADCFEKWKNSWDKHEKRGLRSLSLIHI